MHIYLYISYNAYIPIYYNIRSSTGIIFSLLHNKRGAKQAVKGPPGTSSSQLGELLKKGR